MFTKKKDANIIFRDWESQDATDEASALKLANGDEALAAAAGFLFDYGKHSFDLDRVDSDAIRRNCDDWAKHLLSGSPPPGRKPTRERDWKGARRFVADQRQDERKFVESSLRDLRGVIWEFVHGLSSAVVKDKESDEHVSQHLGRLKTAVQGNSVEDLKREILSAVQSISQAIDSRQQRQVAQMRQLGERLRRMRSELSEARKKMEMDALTGLFNRGAFDEQLQRTADLSILSGQAACLLMVDADHFKKINDSYGHPAGDAVLKELADRCVRNFPRKTDFVARYGGEEIGIIVGDGSLKVCRKLAERLVESVRETSVEHGEGEIAVTISVGLAELQSSDTSASWLQRADDALLQAKQKGRDRVESG